MVTANYADTVLVRGNVRTLNPTGDRATEIAVSGDTIVAVGPDGHTTSWVGPKTSVIDLAGRTVIPGINDAHLHLYLYSIARQPYSLDLQDISCLADLQNNLASAEASFGGEWLIGGKWREGAIAEFADGSVTPHRNILDRATGSRPTMLHHGSLHASWVNTAALRQAGIDGNTPDPIGGRIGRDHDGEPTGMLYESASALVARAFPPLPDHVRLDALEKAMHDMNEMGVTSVTDPVVWPQLLKDYVELNRQGRSTVRINALLHWDWPSTSSSYRGLEAALGHSVLRSGLGDSWVRIGGIKLFADGVPVYRTAWMHEAYPDCSHGSLVVKGHDDASRSAELTSMVALAHHRRLNVQIHVTGDRAADAAIHAIKVAQENDPWPQARHALIHGTLLSREASKQLATHGIAVVTNSLFKASASPDMIREIGQARWAQAFPAGSLLKSGVMVADSTDAPCVAPDWRAGLATFVGARRDGKPLVSGAELLTVDQALRMWTNAGAYLESAESTKGHLSVGALADLAVLDQDPFAIDVHEISGIVPEMTIVGGRIVHDLTASGSQARRRS